MITAVSTDPAASAAAQTEQMHFPHMRLARKRGGGQGFVTTETAEVRPLLLSLGDGTAAAAAAAAAAATAAAAAAALPLLLGVY